jgi:hypothetical protein
MTVEVEKEALEIIKAVVERQPHPAVMAEGRLVHIVFDGPSPGAGSSDSSQRSGHLREVVARLMGTRSEYERLPSRESDSSLVYSRGTQV